MNKSILGQKEDETKPENSAVNRCMTGKNIKQPAGFTAARNVNKTPSGGVGWTREFQSFRACQCLSTADGYMGREVKQVDLQEFRDSDSRWSFP